jgi:hypothetical protein
MPDKTIEKSVIRKIQSGPAWLMVISERRLFERI